MCDNLGDHLVGNVYIKVSENLRPVTNILVLLLPV